MKPDVLEQNLQLLFKKAYAPVLPREAFRLTLIRRVESRAESVRTENRSRLEQLDKGPVHWMRPGVLRVAAALLVALGLFAVFSWTTGRSNSLEDLVATGQAALRETPDGSWRGVSPREFAEGVRIGHGIELVTSARSVRLFLETGGENAQFELESDSHARIDVPEPGASNHEYELSLLSGAMSLQNGALTGLVRHEQSGLSLSSGLALWLARGVRAMTFLPGPAPRNDCLGLRVEAGVLNAPQESDKQASLVLEAGDFGLYCDGALTSVTDWTDTAPPQDSRRVGLSTPQEADSDSAVRKPADESLPGIVVLVRDPEGRPLHGFRAALLETVQLPRAAEPVVKQVLGAEDGTVRFTDVPAADYRLWVFSPGYAVSEQKVSIAGSDLQLEVSMRQEVRLRGVVTEFETSQPVAGALVVSEAMVPSLVLAMFDTEDLETWGSAFAISAPDGSFELGQLSAGSHLLRVSHAEHGVIWHEVTVGPGLHALPEPIEFTLTGQLSGKRRDEAGTPLSGVAVMACAIEFTTRRPCVSFTVTTTDEKGAYSFPHLPFGPYVVLFFAGDSPAGEARIRYAAVSPGPPTIVDDTEPATDPAREIVGRVLDPDGGPAAGMSVLLVPADQPGTIATTWEATLTDGQGRFAFRDLDPGPYQIHFSRNMRDESSLQLEVVVPRTDPDPLILSQLRAGIRGQVIDGLNGNGVADVQLVLHRYLPDGTYEFRGRTRTDGDGHFSVESLPPGRYRLFAVGAVGYAVRPSDAIDVYTGQMTELQFPLFEGGSLVLRVTDSNAQPVSGARIFLREPDGSNRALSMEFTDEGGRLRIDGFPLGKNQLQVRRTGFLPHDFDVVIAPGPPLEHGLRLTPNNENTNR